MKNRIWLMTAITALPLLATAADEDKDKSLTVDAEVGALLTSGNTESTTFKGKLDVKKDLAKWRLNFVADSIFKEDEVQISEDVKEEQKTAEKYSVSLQADYKLNEEHRGLFIFTGYEEDKFSGFEYQGTISAGYTDRFIKTDNVEWNYSIGLGSSFDKPEDIYEDGVLVTEGESEEFTIVRAAFDFRWDISKNAKFTQTFSSNIATESEYNTQTKAESALTANINESFALRATYTITNNTEVPEDKEKTDTTMGLAIVYTY